MFSVGYRSSVLSIASSASRRVYHSSLTAVKNSINRSPPSTNRVSKLSSKRKFTKESSASAKKKTTETTATATTTTTTVTKQKSWIEENPFIFQLGIATCKTSAADLLAQVVAEKKSFNEIDWKRNSIFVVFGFAYLGCFQYWLQITKYRAWFPTMDRFAKLPFAEKLKNTAGMIDAMKMVLFDVVVHLPIIYFPTYYTVKEFVYGTSWNPVEWAKNGCLSYYSNLQDDLTAMIKLWGPADCIQFVLPMHIRLPFRHLVSFFWTAYVSFTRGSVITVAVGGGGEDEGTTTVATPSTTSLPPTLQRQLTTENPK